MKDKPNESPIHYLIRWSGTIVLVMILSIAGHCAMDTYLTKNLEGCHAQAGLATQICVDNMNNTPDDRVKCMNSGADMFRACNDQNPENIKE